MPTVSVTFTALPVHVRTARLVALATARRAGVEEDLLDEIRFAVGEACSRAVGINGHSGRPVIMTMRDERGTFTVEIHDVGTGEDVDADVLADLDHAELAAPEPTDGGPSDAASLPDPLPSGFGLAVISGLVEQVSVTHGLDGTRVNLSWPIPPAPIVPEA